MSSKRLSKKRDSRQIYLSVREKGAKFYSDNDLTSLNELSNAAVETRIELPTTPSPGSSTVTVSAATNRDFVVTRAFAAVGVEAQFGSSSSVQTAPAGNGCAGRERAESLEPSTGASARSGSPQIRRVGRDLHPNGILVTAAAAAAAPEYRQERRRSSGGPLSLLLNGFRGSSELLSGSRGSADVNNAYLTVRSCSRVSGQSMMRQRMLDPPERARMLERYHELRKLVADLREQKSAKEAQLQLLQARERELTGKPQQQQQQQKQQQQQQQPHHSQHQQQLTPLQQQQQKHRELQSAGNRSGLLGSSICLPTQFLVTVDTDAINNRGAGVDNTDADSVLSIELESVKQEIMVQKALVEAHVRLLREAKLSRQSKTVRKQRAADYQAALEKLSQLNLRARYIREQMSSSDWLEEDTISQSSSFAYFNGSGATVGGNVNRGGGDTSSITGSVSSAYHSSSPRNTSTAEYCSESLLSGQPYDARSLVSDLSRESSVRSTASANPQSMSSCILGSQSGYQQPGQQQQQPPPIVPRRSNLGPNARAGSKWRRSNSMGNLLAEADSDGTTVDATAATAAMHVANQRRHQQQQQQHQQRRLPSIPANAPMPTNTNFPMPAPSQPPAPYRRGSNASVSSSASSAALSASQQSPYWYTPRSQLEPVAPQSHRRQFKHHSEI